MRSKLTPSLLCLALAAAPALAGEPFEKLVGDVSVGDVKDSGTTQVPVLTWGGDVATFHANGGRKTADGSIYKGLGLDLEVTSGDDFPAAVRRYLSGESPYLRGTMRMLGLAAELCNKDPRTRPVVFLQLTWSAGDHLLCRPGIETLSDLKGKKIAVQAGGPHLGLLDDALRAARVGWDEVEIVWCKDLTASDDSPAAKFRADPSIAACTVISPDMFALCGDLHGVGSGEGNSVEGSRVLVSTAQMSRSIADVYAVRQDYYKAHRDKVEAFAAGYLKACEVLVDAKAQWEAKEPATTALEKRKRILGKNTYTQALTFAQEIFGKEVLPTLEEDAHGLVSDCSYVGLPGNVSFFTDAGNLSGFTKKADAALSLAASQGYASSKSRLQVHDLDYKVLKDKGGLESELKVVTAERFVDIDVDSLFPEEKAEAKESAKDVILSFTIYFKGNQYDFPEAEYGENFQRACEAASTFGNAVIGIGGHADLKWWLGVVEKGGVASGQVKKTEDGYVYEGELLDLNDTPKLVDLCKKGVFGNEAKSGLEYLNDLSAKRAANVRKAIIDYAAKKGIRLDLSQIKSVAIGIREPAVPQPGPFSDSQKNMRVEFRVIKVRAELPSSGGSFDY